MQKLLINSSLPRIKATLQDPQINSDIPALHMGINDILNLGSTAETVSNSILHIANLCKNYGVKEVCISNVTGTTRPNSDLINDVNNALRNICRTSGYHFLLLWKDVLHLTSSGKGINYHKHFCTVFK